jgi:hypothetical protein
MARHFHHANGHGHIILQRCVGIDDGEHTGALTEFLQCFTTRHRAEGEHIFDSLFALAKEIRHLVSQCERGEGRFEMAVAHFDIQRLDRPAIHLHDVEKLSELQKLAHVTQATGAAAAHHVRAGRRAHHGCGGEIRAADAYTAHFVARGEREL